MKIIRWKLFMFVAMLWIAFSASAQSINELDTSAVEDEIKTVIDDYLKRSELPGAAVLVIKNGKTIVKHYSGFADIERQRHVNNNTVFELGSVSKGFTGALVQYFVNQDQLDLSHSVSHYLPWFKVTYEGQDVEVTVAQLLAHTSGIRFETIGDIPQSSSPDALKNTVEAVIRKHQSLRSYPGTEFHYATINYNLLGRIIEVISGGSFERAVNERLLKPLSLDEVYVWQAANNEQMAQGYKQAWFSQRAYQAPDYRGNVPAGYFLASIDGMEKWVNALLGIAPISPEYESVLAASLVPDYKVNGQFSNSFYASGWNVSYQHETRVFHDGSNPTFSSAVFLLPERQSGVVVLTNTNSSLPLVLAREIGKVMHPTVNEDLTPASQLKADRNVKFDRTASTLIISFSLIAVLLLGLMLIRIKDLFVGKFYLSVKPFTVLSAFVAASFFVIYLAYAIYLSPYVFMDKLNWDFIFIWGPETLTWAAVALGALSLVLIAYLTLALCTATDNRNDFLSVALLSICSGLGNFVLIFTIVQAINTESPLTSGLLIYFVLGLVVYAMGQKLVRRKLVVLSSNLVYRKRMELIQLYLSTPFHSLETIPNEKILAGFNNDAEVISEFPGAAVTSMTHLATLLGCFIYLGSISLLGLALSLFVICLAAGLYIYVTKSANGVLQKTRDCQNIFFRFVNDLIKGRKELNLNVAKAADFKADFEKNSRNYMDYRQIYAFKFANAFVIGELLFTVVIGTAAFCYPLLIEGIDKLDIIAFVLVFIYMAGPINGILNTVPRLTFIRVCWSRINQLIAQMSKMERRVNSLKTVQQITRIQVEEVVYHYQNGESKTFSLGPVSHTFNAGEVTFITGGNGSGKSTFINLLVGLRKPTSGVIKVDDKVLDAEALTQLYATVFADYHLFSTLYGVEEEVIQELGPEWLDLLGIKDKVEIKDGKFSTVQLSTGQRKRLALLVSVLDSRPVFVFDEWAAEQDPEFRNFFYTHILQKLKQQGKCVIAVTHDDKYFDLADSMIKLDMGQAVIHRNFNSLQEPKILRDESVAQSE